MSHLKDCLFCAALGLCVTIIGAGAILTITYFTGVDFYTVALFAVVGISMAIALACVAEMYVERRVKQRPSLTSDRLEEMP